MNHPLYQMEIRHETDIVVARQKARQICQVLGFDPQDQTRISTAVSEAVRTALGNSSVGFLSFNLSAVPGPSLFVELRFTHKRKSFDSNRAEFSYGNSGFTGAERLMDSFHLDSGPWETKVQMGKALPKTFAPIHPHALSSLIDPAESISVEDPWKELVHQNQELIHALEQLKLKKEELLSLNDELESTNRGVVALYAELDEKALALQAANQAKTRFLSNVTHEFRTPVNSILNLARLLLDGTEGELTASQKKVVAMMQNAACSLSEMVNDLLDLAKVEAGMISVKPTRFSLEELFSSLRGLFKPLISENSAVQLLIDDASSLPEVISDEGKISQILRNFISNALKFTEKGTVSVHAQLRDSETLEIQVSDTGIGISETDQRIIFEEFVQVDSPLQRKNKGTGLGLPLTRKLATLLGGSVQLQSIPGKGSVFTVLLPLNYQGPLEGSFVSKTKAAPKQTSKKILIIDQDHPKCESLKKLIHQEIESEVFIEEDIQRGLDLVKTQSFDLIFSSEGDAFQTLQNELNSNQSSTRLHSTQERNDVLISKVRAEEEAHV